LLTQLYRHFEVNNLKAILRGIATHSTWDQVRFVLFPIGAITVLRPQEMMEAGSLSAAVDLLRGTPYYETVAHAMKRYTTEQNLFILEVAIDLEYWRRLWKALKGLPSQDRIPAQKIIGALVDMNNLMWAIRYRTFHHLSEEELINYTLPFGQSVKDDDIRAIAAGADYLQVVSKIFPQLGRLEMFSEEPEKRLIELERNLQLRLISICRSVFAGNSFHVGIMLAYLLLCEMEIQDLTLLFEAKAQQQPPRVFQRFIVMNRPEEGH
jgi:V/A-type H+/Na+-transporting ATPase subunit C